MKKILEAYRNEKLHNNLVCELQKQCKENNLMITRKTLSNGNCLFDALQEYGIGIIDPYPEKPNPVNYNNIEEYTSVLNDWETVFEYMQEENIKKYRKFLAYFIYQNKSRCIFPGNPMSLETMFECFNETQYAKIVDDNKKEEYHKYSFDIMCKSLATNCNWNDLLTQMILMVISLIHKVHIVTAFITGGTATIRGYQPDDPNIKKIYLGVINDYHYMAADVLGAKPDPDQSLYEFKKTTEFLEWISTVCV